MMVRAARRLSRRGRILLNCILPVSQAQVAQHARLKCLLGAYEPDERSMVIRQAEIHVNGFMRSRMVELEAPQDSDAY